ncbi:response regulator transcription factor [Pedobacter frigidisoli]|uniref:Response regulator transcription factor n=1 Tax=Pedobacter frigidisoli TaxID=2530455 RepID=A0A4R0NRK6_9SPHI|nr:response regulator transcription factor [Pedobacter frigidisoli]TCD01985.1 response regulator transcription factor [Pedobacter frigidisoli]
MISISIVEDHEQYRHNLVKAIEQNKSFVIKGVYSSAEDAMKKLAIDSPDIAIVDIKLKSKSGIDLILETKDGLKNTQFLMCTGFQDDEKIFSALKAGASGYIIKGSSTTEIHDALLELHDGGSPMSPFIARKVISHLHKSKQEPKADVLGLSKREIDVLILLSKGLQYKEISEKLFISANTVKNHCKNIYKRLHVQNKVEALNKFKFFNYQSPTYVS